MIQRSLCAVDRRHRSKVGRSDCAAASNFRIDASTKKLSQKQSLIAEDGLQANCFLPSALPALGPHRLVNRASDGGETGPRHCLTFHASVFPAASAVP
jgi:hypothetical protein